MGIPENTQLFMAKNQIQTYEVLYMCVHAMLGWAKFSYFPELNSAQLVPPLSASGRATGRGAEPSRRGPDGVRRRRLGNGDLASRVAAADCVAVESILPIG